MAHVAICQGPNLEVLDVCQGAAPDGGCPQAGAGEPVRCAGLQLVFQHDRNSPPFVLHVERDATTCPAAALGLLPLLKKRSARAGNSGKEI